MNKDKDKKVMNEVHAPHTQGKELLLDVKNLSTHFFTPDGIVKAVDDISFVLRKGEVLGLVGESGCGKSVTVMSLLKLIPKPGQIVSGSVNYKGVDLIKCNTRTLQKIRGNNISMIFQDPMTSLNPFMRISSQIMEPLMIHRGMKKKQAFEKAIDILKMVGISDAEQRIRNYPHEFSGGMRQRAMIAMALACEPDILIADEPTTALDVSVQIQILETIKELATMLGTAVIFITHDLGVVANMCDRVHVMYAGRIVEEAPVTRLFKHPAHPYTQGLIDSVQQLFDDTQEPLRVIEGHPPTLVNMPDACLFYPRCPHAHELCTKKRPPRVHLHSTHMAECWLHATHQPDTFNTSPPLPQQASDHEQKE